MSKKVSILFVCLGNICRSPLAEGVFRHLIQERGLEERFEIDSCGTGAWHIGNPPHEETQRNATQNGISLDGQKARQVSRSDFSRFDLIVAMDKDNKADLEDFNESVGANIVLLREFDPEKSGLSVPDPYFGGVDGFQTVFEIVHRSCINLLDQLQEKL